MDILRHREDVDASISGTAAYIASMPDVVSMLEDGYPDSGTGKTLDSLCDNMPDISVVVICDKNGLRFYHTDRQKTGETFVDGDETDVLSGSGPYITIGYGTRSSQRRAFHSVTDPDGDIIGFVMASVFTAHISNQQKNIIWIHLAILGSMIFVSFFLSRTVVRYLRRSLGGFHPNELLQMYMKQEEVLNAVEEGLIASDLTGRILFANQIACRLFAGDCSSLTGQQIGNLYPQTKADNILRTGSSGHSHTTVISGHTVLINEIPIRNDNVPAEGILTILFDQTEMLRITDELSGTRSMLDTFRAFNHEFLNKLHIILGYLQSGETKRAMDFIINSNLVSSESVRQTADAVRVSQICALVIGKMMHAAELGILLTLTHDSRCMEKDLLLSADSFVTLIGNLLENAIEELNSREQEIKEIKLGIYCRPDCNIITCEDTGGGIRPELADHIFDNGISSKGDNRGTGLFLIRRITESCHGEITVETEQGEGTCFTLTFTGKENPSCTE